METKWEKMKMWLQKKSREKFHWKDYWDTLFWTIVSVILFVVLYFTVDTLNQYKVKGYWCRKHTHHSGIVVAASANMAHSGRITHFFPLAGALDTDLGRSAVFFNLTVYCF